MATFWFAALAFALIAYVILDGFDLGAGYVSAFVARTPEERRAVIAAIGPFWDGNEVWLLATGGILFMAFPRAYASSFAGFYLPLTIVLWLLILRGIAIEFGSHLNAPLWRAFWDAVFAGSSMLLARLFGVALGNVMRGVPLDAEGRFFLPLWTNPFTVGGELGVLDWYTVTVGLAAALALARHGALWVNYRVTGELQQRSAEMARRLMPGVLILTLAMTVCTFIVQPQTRLTPFAAFALAGLWLAWNPERGALRAFLGSSLFLAGLLASAAASLYPALLPARPNAALSLTIRNAQSSEYALGVALYWWLPALGLTLGYFAFLYRRFTANAV